MEFSLASLVNSLLLAQAPAVDQAAYIADMHGRGWQVILVTVMSSGIAQALKVFTKLATTG